MPFKLTSENMNELAAVALIRPPGNYKRNYLSAVHRLSLANNMVGLTSTDGSSVWLSHKVPADAEENDTLGCWVVCDSFNRLFRLARGGKSTLVFDESGDLNISKVQERFVLRSCLAPGTLEEIDCGNFESKTVVHSERLSDTVEFLLPVVDPKNTNTRFHTAVFRTDGTAVAANTSVFAKASGLSVPFEFGLYKDELRCLASWLRTINSKIVDLYIERDRRRVMFRKPDSDCYLVLRVVEASAVDIPELPEHGDAEFLAESDGLLQSCEALKACTGGGVLSLTVWGDNMSMSGSRRPIGYLKASMASGKPFSKHPSTADSEKISDRTIEITRCSGEGQFPFAVYYKTFTSSVKLLETRWNRFVVDNERRLLRIDGVIFVKPSDAGEASDNSEGTQESQEPPIRKLIIMSLHQARQPARSAEVIGGSYA